MSEGAVMVFLDGRSGTEETEWAAAVQVSKNRIFQTENKKTLR